jgi:general secretion pathway protein C
MRVRLLTFVVWALLAGSSAYWLLKLLPGSTPVPPQAVLAGDGGGTNADLSRLLGPPRGMAEAPMVAADSRFKLIGLVAPKHSSGRHAGEGVAVIAVDDKPPRTVRIGAQVDGDLQLLALDAKSAGLGSQGVISMRLNLAPPAPPATGSRPAPTASAQPSSPLPAQPMPKPDPAPNPVSPRDANTH